MKTGLDTLDATLGMLAASSLCANLALHWAYRRGPSAPAADGGFAPPISVLKPLCGVDEGLYENLLSFVCQRYPDFELVIGVAEPDDPALEVVARVSSEFPQANIRVIVHHERSFANNPKVISLLHMLRAARYEHVLVSDSNVRAAPDYLASIAAEMGDPTVGLVSNLIVGEGERSVGAQCENLHLNTFVSGGVCMADVAERPCVVGKSMLMRRSELAALGGFETLREILAEDYVLGQRFHAAGYRVVLSRHRVATYNQRLTMRRFLARHLRWAQLRRRCALGPFCSEVLLYSTPWLVAPALCTEAQAVWLTCLLALCARIGSDGLMARQVSGRWPSVRALALLPVKDTLLLGVWATALLRRSVAWRGHTLRIDAGSRLVDPHAGRRSQPRPAAALQ